MREKQSRGVPSSSPVQLPLSDARSHVLALVDMTAPSWEEVPVLAGGGLARANVDGGLGWGRVWRSDCSLLAKRECAGGRGAGRGAPPGEASLPAQSSSPALTCTIGARLAWIALMISSVLIPWRYTLVVDTYECWICG